MRRVRFPNDTLHVMARWAAHRYGLNVEVMFYDRVEGKNRSGCAGLIRPGVALVMLNTHQTHSKLVQVLAHELAHVLSFKRRQHDGHGPKFRQNFCRLVGEWNSYANRGGVR